MEYSRANYRLFVTFIGRTWKTKLHNMYKSRVEKFWWYVLSRYFVIDSSRNFANYGKRIKVTCWLYLTLREMAIILLVEIQKYIIAISWQRFNDNITSKYVHKYDYLRKCPSRYHIWYTQMICLIKLHKFMIFSRCILSASND